MPSAATDARAKPQTNFSIVHKLQGTLTEITPKIETKTAMAQLKTDLREFIIIFRQKRVLLDPTRANIIKLYIELEQSITALYAAYVAASKTANAKYYDNATFN